MQLKRLNFINLMPFGQIKNAKEIFWLKLIKAVFFLNKYYTTVFKLKKMSNFLAKYFKMTMARTKIN